MNINKDKILHKDLCYEINGICFQVHNNLGRFCKEKQYCDELEKLLKLSKLKYKREFEINAFETESPKGNRVDFLIENQIIIEVKAKKFLTKEDYYQIQRYLSCANLELGLLVNFRNTYIKPKRVLNSKYKNH